MSSSFAITTAANSTPLDGNRKGETVFTVSNTSVRSLRGRARITPDNAAAATWFALVGGAERDFTVNGTQQYTVQIAVPPAAPAGNYTLRLDMVGVDNPDEDFIQGPSVTFAVPAPLPVKKPFPWWIIAVVVGLVIVGIVLASMLSPKAVEVPNLIGSPLIVAQSTLEASGLKVSVVQATAESAQQNRVVAQNPASGARVQNGSAITLSVGVVPPSPTPTPTATPTPTPTPTATPDRQTTTQLTSSPADSATRGQSVTIIAQVTAHDGHPPTGNVSFVAENGSSIPGCTSPVPVNNGLAACTTAGLPAGKHTVTATYNGDTNHNASVSRPSPLTVTPANTSVSITANVSFSFPTWRLNATATVKNTSSGSALIPVGTVTFRFAAGGSVTKTCTLNASGVCSVSFTNAVPLAQVSATYNPSTGDFNASTSSIGVGR